MKLERLISMIYKLLNHEVLSASMLAEESLYKRVQIDMIQINKIQPELRNYGREGRSETAIWIHVTIFLLTTRISNNIA